MTAGIVAGTAATFVWKLVPWLSSTVYELVPAFALSSLATVAVSLATSPPQQTDEMFVTMSGRKADTESAGR